MILLDWLIVLSYIIFALSLGFYFRKKASGGVESFFLSGRKIPWYILGVSMVATTFAADTPLAVTGLVRDQGLSGNWIWWNMAIGWVIAVFFYAQLWRRAGIVTDAEFISLRYSGASATLLRRFYAVYNGLIINVIISSWVINAMGNILKVLLGWQETWQVVFLLVAIAAVYAVLSGFWGVVYTDLFQFIFALSGSIFLAYYAADAAGGLQAIQQHAQDIKALDFFPDFQVQGVMMTFVAYLGVQWWAQRESSMPGYFAQRMFAAKTPEDARKSALMFNYLHYAVRPWPWILAALASLVLFNSQELSVHLSHLPVSQQNEAAYALLIVKVLPAGIMGFVVMSLVAAFMSTIDTQANWGASYLVQDLYIPLRRKKEQNMLGAQGDENDSDQKSIIFFSRMAMLFIILASALLSFFLTSVTETWKFIFSFTSGLGPVYLLRWYWSRITPASEMSAMISSAVLTLVFTIWDPFPKENAYAAQLFCSVLGSALIWLPVTLLGKASDQDTLRRFFMKVHGPSFDHVQYEQTLQGWGVKTQRNWLRVIRLWLQVIAVLAAIAGTLWGIRELLFGTMQWGVGAVILSMICLTFAFYEKRSVYK